MAVASRQATNQNLSLLQPSRRRQLTTHATASVETRQRRGVVDSSRALQGAPVLSRPSQQGAASKSPAGRPKIEAPETPDRHELPETMARAEAREQSHRMDGFDRFEYVPDDVIKEFEAKLQGDLQSVFATLFAGIGVITWWRGVWALLDHYVGDSVFGHWMCVITGLMIILYIRFSGYKLTNFFPPS